MSKWDIWCPVDEAVEKFLTGLVWVLCTMSGIRILAEHFYPHLWGR